MKVKNIYTSVACNQTTESADWGKNGLIVFAANNAVVLMNPQFYGSCKIIQTYVEHKKRVNTVKWIKQSENNDKGEFEIISGSDDGNAIIWNIKNQDSPKYYKLIGHQSGVNCVETLYVNKILNVATASMDSSIKLWKKNDNHDLYECFQTISLKVGFCFAMKMIIIPLTNQILFAYGDVSGNIIFLTEEIYNNTKDKKFKKIYELHSHEDWIRCLDFKHMGHNEFLLASSSQDAFIHIWKLSVEIVEETLNKKQVINKKLNCFNGYNTNSVEVEKIILNIVLLENNKKCKISMNIDSVLQGHEGWVYGVNWKKDNSCFELLSSSIDKTLIIWAQNEEGIWMEKVRLGDVGGNSLGFFGGKFSHDGKSIFGHGFQGTFHIWRQNENNEILWDPQIVVGGHFNEVRDITWEKCGYYLLSVSADQTARIHAPWIRKSNEISNEEEIITWHEIARPQIHGYNMQCVTLLSRYKFASGAEEKIVRIFQTSTNFIENFRRLCNIENDPEGDEIMEYLPKGASVPSLGLSNKAVYNFNENNLLNKKHVKDEYLENYFVPLKLDSPPQEEILLQNTLWPEIQKLYGHGYEIFTLCTSVDGKLLASSCKANSNEHAQIIIWKTSTWEQIQKLSSHQLTVTQMKFSPNNQYLLSVSRDRTWTLFENEDSFIISFKIITKSTENPVVHNRIIWSCDWSHDTKLFSTTSRDGKCALWQKRIENNSWKCLSFLELKNESITAVAFAPFYVKNNEYLISLGLENGSILLYTFYNGTWNQLSTLNKHIAHHSVVKKLQFRPGVDDKNILLASCGEDNFVKLYKIILY